MLQGHAAHTLTLDNGREFAGHERIALRSQCQVFFADPYSSWQRGTNENTNGLLRQYFPKGSDFSKLTVEAVNRSEEHTSELQSLMRNSYAVFCLKKKKKKQKPTNNHSITQQNKHKTCAPQQA